MSPDAFINVRTVPAKITNYHVTVNRADELAGCVQARIVEGWQPYGPPTFVKEGHPDFATFVTGFQAMVRYEEVAK